MDYEIAKHLGEAEPASDEPALNSEIIDANIQMLPSRSHDLGKRAQHPKVHATVDAKFIVDGLGDELADLRKGLFAASGEYDAKIRFSNSASFEDNPKKGDAHGMAIKVFGVEGEKFIENENETDTQDFILLDNETFFEGDLRKYTVFHDDAGEIVRARRGDGIDWVGMANKVYLGAKLLTVNRDLKEQLKETSNQFPFSPLTTPYWSTTPYLLGTDQAVKYTVRPGSGHMKDENLHGDPKNENIYGERMKAAMKAGPSSFEFCVILQESDDVHPIEDPRIDWEKEHAKTVRVARIEIPQNSDLTDAEWTQLQNQGEQLGFNIWNCLFDHRPLGAINRCRGQVYPRLRQERDKLLPNRTG